MTVSLTLVWEMTLHVSGPPLTRFGLSDRSRFSKWLLKVRF